MTFNYLEGSKIVITIPQALLLSADLSNVGHPEVSEAKLEEAAKILPDEPLVRFALAGVFITVVLVRRRYQFY